jgi:hypothetical protein
MTSKSHLYSYTQMGREGWSRSPLAGLFNPETNIIYILYPVKLSQCHKSAILECNLFQRIQKPRSRPSRAGGRSLGLPAGGARYIMSPLARTAGFSTMYTVCPNSSDCPTRKETLPASPRRPGSAVLLQCICHVTPPDALGRLLTGYRTPLL